MSVLMRNFLYISVHSSLCLLRLWLRWVHFSCQQVLFILWDYLYQINIVEKLSIVRMVDICWNLQIFLSVVLPIILKSRLLCSEISRQTPNEKQIYIYLSVRRSLKRKSDLISNYYFGLQQNEVKNFIECRVFVFSLQLNIQFYYMEFWKFHVLYTKIILNK